MVDFVQQTIKVQRDAATCSALSRKIYNTLYH